MTPQGLAAHHAPLLRELRALRALAGQVLRAHEAECGKRLHEVWALIADLLEDLEPHLRDEEDAEFAANRELRFDHAQVRLLLEDLRCQTRGYRPPEGACSTWSELWRRLGALDGALREQMRTEEDFSQVRSHRQSPGCGRAR